MNELDPQSEAERAWANYLAWASSRKYQSIRRRSDRRFAIGGILLGFVDIGLAALTVGMGPRDGLGWFSYPFALCLLAAALYCFRSAFKWLRQTD